MLTIITDARYCLRQGFPGLIVDDDLILYGSRIKTHPDRAQLCQRAEQGSSELIDIMIKAIRAGDELRLAGFDC